MQVGWMSHDLDYELTTHYIYDYRTIEMNHTYLQRNRQIFQFLSSRQNPSSYFHNLNPNFVRIIRFLDLRCMWWNVRWKYRFVLKADC
ncbi:hypothetical protein L1987_70504 [Smallanthus sonchifolius]|uniref:Uncharacterized protein n=1 Tax=Smallanthus sonchifolius TaxID=185202 RepID=A0ACB9AU45_9ASTR|nr:hypothetical protein L1987_70504 [Smallanthus sonchifolius]